METRGTGGRAIESPFLDEELFGGEREMEWESRLTFLGALTPFAEALQDLPAETEGESGPEAEQETDLGLRKKLTHLAFLPHSAKIGGSEVAVSPSAIDPGIYDGPQKYKIGDDLQKCLNGVMGTAKFRHIKAALVDLTKAAPQFAGFNHKTTVFAASVPKLAAMLAAFQLRHDLRVALDKKTPPTLTDLFKQVRDDWAAAAVDPKGAATPFSDGITLRGKVVLWRGAQILLDDDQPKTPQLETIFKPVSGAPSVEFTTTGENFTELQTLVHDFKSEDKDKKKAATDGLQALGFLERLKVAMGGSVPASNFMTSTIVRQVGYAYIASTLMQYGLYDPNRNGGLWLGHSYWGQVWRGDLFGEPAQSATSGGSAAFMTMLIRDLLVDPGSCSEMRDLIRKEPFPTHPTIVSWFEEGLMGLPLTGSRKLVLSKLGVAGGGIDDCAFICREVDNGSGGKKLISYVAVGLRSKKKEELKALILEFDKCILVNNGLTPALGGHDHEIADEAEDLPSGEESYDVARENED